MQGGSAVSYTLTDEQQAIINAITKPIHPVLSVQATAG